jgi:hypothetical protein
MACPGDGEGPAGHDRSFSTYDRRNRSNGADREKSHFPHLPTALPSGAKGGRAISLRLARDWQYPGDERARRIGSAAYHRPSRPSVRPCRTVAPVRSMATGPPE